MRLSSWSEGPADVSGAPDATIVFRSSEFVQEGPSGPVECKKVIAVHASLLQKTCVRFDTETRMSTRIGFCATAPLMVEHVSDDQFV